MISNSGIPAVEWLIALALVAVVPLGLRLGRLPRGAWWAVVPAAVLAVASLFVAEPLPSALLTLPWLLTSLWLAGHALVRLLARGPCAEALVDIGQLELVVASSWLLASRAGWGLGFTDAIVALTSAHFHYAGFAAATIAGVVLRRVKAPVSGVVVALGPPLVGLGIAISPVVEVVSAVVLALGMLGLARAMVRFHRALVLPALPLLGTMALAVTWALQELTGAHWLFMETMARWHGVGNAVGFGLCGLLLLQWLAPPEGRTVPVLPPLPALVPGSGPAPRGLYPSLQPFGLEGTPPEVQAYQLDSAGVVLLLRPSWSSPALGGLVNRLGRVMGNLVLPFEPRVHRITNTLSAMDAPGWTHSLRRTEDGQPVFRLAYGAVGPLMRVVAPLPVGCLDVLLRGSGTDVHELCTEELYWVWGPLRVWLPLEERLVGWVEAGHFRATQRFVFLGRTLVRFEYAIAADPDPGILDDPSPAPR